MAGLPIIHGGVCRARGDLIWHNPARGQRFHDFDAVFFLCLLGLPVIPIRAAHVYRYQVKFLAVEYEWHPIRWSAALLLRAWLRRASLAALLYALPLGTLAGLALLARPDPAARVVLWGSVAAVIAWPVIGGLLALRDRRNRDIRTVIGNWDLGSGDPATYDPAWVADKDFATPGPLYGTDTFAQGATNCIGWHNWWGAMFAARLCLLLEDRRQGEELTDAVLAEPEVREGIAAVRADPRQWHALLGPGRYEGS